MHHILLKVGYRLQAILALLFSPDNSGIPVAGPVFHAALPDAGKTATLLVGLEYNHFGMIETLGNPCGVPGRPMLEMFSRASGGD
jgi:hypothetical protein